MFEEILILVLAVYILVRIMTREHGPKHIFTKMRKGLGMVAYIEVNDSLRQVIFNKNTISVGVVNRNGDEIVIGGESIPPEMVVEGLVELPIDWSAYHWQSNGSFLADVVSCHVCAIPWLSIFVLFMDIMLPPIFTEALALMGATLLIFDIQS